MILLFAQATDADGSEDCSLMPERHATGKAGEARIAPVGQGAAGLPTPVAQIPGGLSIPRRGIALVLRQHTAVQADSRLADKIEQLAMAIADREGNWRGAGELVIQPGSQHPVQHSMVEGHGNSRPRMVTYN